MSDPFFVRVELRASQPDAPQDAQTTTDSVAVRLHVINARVKAAEYAQSVWHMFGEPPLPGPGADAARLVRQAQTASPRTRLYRLARRVVGDENTYWWHLNRAQAWWRDQREREAALPQEIDRTEEVSLADDGMSPLEKQQQKERDAVLTQIDKDILRTPFDLLQRAPESGSDEALATYRTNLRKVLIAFASANKKIGYCQSMNFIVAMWLQAGLTDEQAFHLLNYVAELFATGYWTTSMEGIRTDQLVMEHLLREHLPNVIAHLDTLELAPTVFISPWLLQLYTSLLGPRAALAIWDMMLFERSLWHTKAILFSVGTAILRKYEREILSTEDVGALLEKFNQGFARSFTDPIEVIEMAANSLSTVPLARLQELWGVYRLRTADVGSGGEKNQKTDKDRQGRQLQAMREENQELEMRVRMLTESVQKYKQQLEQLEDDKQALIGQLSLRWEEVVSLEEDKRALMVELQSKWSDVQNEHEKENDDFSKRMVHLNQSVRQQHRNLLLSVGSSCRITRRVTESLFLMELLANEAKIRKKMGKSVRSNPKLRIQALEGFCALLVLALGHSRAKGSDQEGERSGGGDKQEEASTAEEAGREDLPADETLLQASFIDEMDSILGIDAKDEGDGVSDTVSESSVSTTTEGGSVAASESRDADGGVSERRRGDKGKRSGRGLFGVLMGVAERGKAKN